MNRSLPKLWRPVLAGIIVCLGLSTFVVWNRIMLAEWDRQETEQRFALNIEALSQRIQARMSAYEAVLRGISSAFAGVDYHVTPAQWRAIVDQIRVQELYPGIRSIAWSRYVRREHREDFLALMRADGRPHLRIFPEGEREHYLPLEYIGPVNERTSQVLGLDLLTQQPQQRALVRAIDTARVMMSRPVPDLYVVSAETDRGAGVLMYFPVYASAIPPESVQARRATLLGVAVAASPGGGGRRFSGR